jgi:hypothetical protein
MCFVESVISGPMRSAAVEAGLVEVLGDSLIGLLVVGL